ncbi:MAG TPA: methyltransferase domain-containing protein [Gemmatimonadaceae bacterium]|nr:methyltransferase domain-containing protein [Gemmatimonadaceae bacterium]
MPPCPVCARADPLPLAAAEDIAREVEMLWAFHIRRLLPATPPERLADRVYFSQHPPLGVVRCRGCGLVYREPREPDGELRELYEHDAPEPEVMASLHETQRAAYRLQARRLARVLGRTGEGLEVGSYVGAFLAAAREAGWRFEGVDVNPCVNAFARARGFAVTDGDLSSVPGGRRWDAIAFWNCFDQLPDPARAARQARALLRDGGTLAVRVPNGACYAALRPLLRGPAAPLARAILAQNNLLTFPYRVGFTPRALRTLLEGAGFTLVRLYGDPLVPVADEYTRAWAAVEERLLKGAIRVAALPPVVRGVAPWIECYARARNAGIGTRDSMPDD